MTDSGDKVDALGEKFLRAGQIIGDIGGIFAAVWEAAGPAIEEVMVGISEGLASLRGDAEGNIGPMSDYFLDVVDNMRPLMGLIGDLLGLLTNLGADPNIGKMWETLREGVPALESIIREGSAAGPALAELAVSVAELLAAFAETGALDVFFETLTEITDWLGEVFKDPGVQDFVRSITPALAVMKALSLAFMAVSFVSKLLLGPFLKIGKLVKKLIDGWRLFGNILLFLRPTLMAIGAAIGAISWPVVAVVAAIGALIAIFVLLYKKNEGFRKFVDGIVAKVKELWNKFVEFIGKIPEWWNGVWESLSDAWDQYGKPLFEFIGDAFKVFFDIATAPLRLMIALWGFLWESIQTLWDSVGKPIFDFIADAFKFLAIIVAIPIATIIATWSFLWDSVKKLWKKYGEDTIEKIKSAWNKFKEKLEELWEGVKKAFSDLWEGVKAWYNNNIKPWIDRVAGWWEDFKDSVSAIWDSLVGLFESAWDAVSGWYARNITPWIDDIVEWWGDLKDDLAGIWDGFKDAFKDAWDSVSDWYDRNIGAKIEKIKDAWKGIGKWFGGIWENARHYAAKAINKIIGTLNSFVVDNEQGHEEVRRRDQPDWDRRSSAARGSHRWLHQRAWWSDRRQGPREAVQRRVRGQGVLRTQARRGHHASDQRRRASHGWSRGLAQAGPRRCEELRLGGARCPEGGPQGCHLLRDQQDHRPVHRRGYQARRALWRVGRRDLQEADWRNPVLGRR